MAYAFPRVRIITTAVDKRINEEFHIIPGIGEGGWCWPWGQPPTLQPPTLQPLAVPRGPALTWLCPHLLQVTSGTGTSAPTPLLPAVRAKPWTAELGGPREGCSPPSPCPPAAGALLCCRPAPAPSCHARGRGRGPGPAGTPLRVGRLRRWTLYLFVFIVSSRPPGSPRGPHSYLKTIRDGGFPRSPRLPHTPLPPCLEAGDGGVPAPGGGRLGPHRSPFAFQPRGRRGSNPPRDHAAPPLPRSLLRFFPRFGGRGGAPGRPLRQPRGRSPGRLPPPAAAPPVPGRLRFVPK